MIMSGEWRGRITWEKLLRTWGTRLNLTIKSQLAHNRELNSLAHSQIITIKMNPVRFKIFHIPFVVYHRKDVDMWFLLLLLFIFNHSSRMPNFNPSPLISLLSYNLVTSLQTHSS